MNIFRRIWNWIFYPRNDACVGVTAGGTSPLAFDGCNDSCDIYELSIDEAGTVHIGGEVPDHLARWDGTTWDVVSHLCDSPTNRYTYSIEKDGITRDVSREEFEAHGGHVNDYSRPMTYWDLKDRRKCVYCGSVNDANNLDCRKCGAPLP